MTEWLVSSTNAVTDCCCPSGKVVTPMSELQDPADYGSDLIKIVRPTNQHLHQGYRFYIRIASEGQNSPYHE
jgi:hypothetical protein